jgi:hypothetical protein
VVDEVLARVYPSRTWGEPDPAAFLGGATADDAAALAEELAGELGAATFHVPGGADELCEYVWVLCVGRTPCLLQAREFGAQLDESEAVSEVYLRICLSAVARLAAVQQVTLDGELLDGGWLVRERPRAGVYDPPLLRRFQRLVAILPAYDLVHLDFGEIAGPPAGMDAGAWPGLYAPDPTGVPSIANYLFFPRPAAMVSTTYVLDQAPVEGCSTTR